MRQYGSNWQYLSNIIALQIQMMQCKSNDWTLKYYYYNHNVVLLSSVLEYYDRYLFEFTSWNASYHNFVHVCNPIIIYLYFTDTCWCLFISIFWRKLVICVLFIHNFINRLPTTFYHNYYFQFQIMCLFKSIIHESS